MFFEDLLLILISLLGFGLIGTSLFKIIKQFLPATKNPVKEAKLHFQEAQLLLEAAKLDKETNEVYAHLYEDILENKKDLNESK